MVKNGKGKEKPNSAEKVSSQSVVLEERQTVRVTGGTADSESDSTRVRCSSDVVSLIERRGSDVLRSGLALREKSCRVVQDVTDKDSQEATPESCGDGAMVDADPVAVGDGNKREEGARGEGEINSGGTCAQSKRERESPRRSSAQFICDDRDD